jgi:protein tyrosine phosphatase (PTP) superfamily phosphohydrolase (DUF442 family)
MLPVGGRVSPPARLRERRGWDQMKDALGRGVPRPFIGGRRLRRMPRRRLAAVAAAAILVLGAGLAWRVGVLRSGFATVAPGILYRSAAPTPGAVAAWVRAHGIRTVIDLRQPGGPGTEGEGMEAERAAVEGAGARHVNLPSDQEPSATVVGSFLGILDDPSRRPCLVHCRHGTGRTEIMVAIYRMEYEGWDNRRALEATRWILAGSAFDPERPKGRFLLGYRPRRALAAEPGG